MRLLREAQSLQKSMHDAYIAQDHLLLALLKDPNMADVFKSCAISETALKSAVEQMRGNKRVDSKNAESGFDALNKYVCSLFHFISTCVLTFFFKVCPRLDCARRRGQAGSRYRP